MSDDPREQFVSAVKRGLRVGPLKRRRVVRELAGHLEDTVSELEARGMDESSAVREALRRIGDAGTVTSAFRDVRPRRRRLSRVRSLRSPAWVAVAAMSLVTAVAAELPQASGARPTASALPATHVHRVLPLAHREHRRDRDRYSQRLRRRAAS